MIPKVAEGIFDVIAVFNATNEYVLYYHRFPLLPPHLPKLPIAAGRPFGRSGGGTGHRSPTTGCRWGRRCPRQADLRGLGTTGDGRSVVLGMGDGSLTTLAIADPAHPGTSTHLAQLPSR